MSLSKDNYDKKIQDNVVKSVIKIKDQCETQSHNNCRSIIKKK